ncbi:MAG: hypothetical protein ACRDPW_06940 [Mycobacteriales bacterium]
MVALVVPVGHFAGPMYTSMETEVPESFEVRFRDGVFSLSAEEYAVWAVSHGDPEKVSKQPQSRPVVETAAKAAGVEDPGPIFDSLVDDGLLVSVMPTGNSARTFAEQHQMVPLALGLGNSAQKPAEFQIGLPNAARVSVGYDVYHMWLFCHRQPTLWEAISTIADEAKEANTAEDPADGDAAVAGEEKVELVSDPDVLLKALLAALPVLISTSCVFIDRRP